MGFFKIIYQKWGLAKQRKERSFRAFPIFLYKHTDVYKGSFFPQTIRDWNALPDSLISSAEDAEDCVAKFTSLVRARD